MPDLIPANYGGKVTGVSAETSPGEADDYQETERGVSLGPWIHTFREPDRRDKHPPHGAPAGRMRIGS